MQSLTSVVDAQPDAQAAFNLVLCTFALGDKEMMKQAFTSLMEVRQKVTLPLCDMIQIWCFDSLAVLLSAMKRFFLDNMAGKEALQHVHTGE